MDQHEELNFTELDAPLVAVYRDGQYLSAPGKTPLLGMVLG